MKSSRRHFIATSTAAVVGASLTAIPRNAKAQDAVSTDYVLTAQYQDTGTDWNGANEDTLMVRAEDFIVGSVSGLVADEGSHQHTFDVSVEDMEKLKRGEVVKIRTAITLNHSHLITIDPVNFKIPGGTVIQVKDVSL